MEVPTGINNFRKSMTRIRRKASDLVRQKKLERRKYYWFFIPFQDNTEKRKLTTGHEGEE